MPVREKYSRNIGIWTGEAPQPNEVWHMWNYQDTRTAPRLGPRCSRIRNGWRSWRKAGAVVEMNNVMLIPTDYSGLK